MGSSPKRTYQCERIARQHPDHQCKRIALQHPDRWWFGFMGDAPRSPEDEADEEAIDAIEADLDAAGQLPGEYDPSPGTSFADLSLAQRRLVLEQRHARVTILRKEADARVARRRAKLPAGWREPMPLKTVMQRNAREKWIVASRVARRLAQVEAAAKAALDALPKRCPSTLTFRGRDVVTGTASSRVGYTYLDKPRPPAKLPVKRGGGHNFWSARRKCQCIAWGVVAIFALQFYIGVLESLPPSYQPAAASAGVPTVFAFLNHTQIVNDEDGSFLLMANGSVYLMAEIGGPDDPWGGDMAEFSFEEIDSDLPGEQWYTCTTGLHSWAYQLPDEMTLCNLTIPEWCRSRFTSLSVQPLYIAQGEVNVTRTAPAHVVFNATGDIAILLWTMGNFSDLAVTLDGVTLKANTYENLRHMSIVVAQDVFGSEWLRFPARVPAGQHDLEIWGEFNQTIYYTCVHGTADFEEDLLLDYEEMMSGNPALCPEVANLWGYQYITGTTNDISIEDIIMGDNAGYWAPEMISFYVPDDHVVEPYDPLSDDYDEGTMGLEIVSWNGQYTNFTVDGNSACLANITLAGYTGSEFTPRTVVDSEGVALGTFMDYQLIFPSFVSCEISGPGWHELVYEVFQGASVMPDLELSIDGQLVCLNPVYPDLANADADNDTVPDDADRSPTDRITWRKDTLLQLTVPCDRTSGEDVKIVIDVVRGPEDPDPSKELIWHGGEVGERKVRLTQAMILYGPGDNAPAQGLTDYWDTLNELQIFMNNSEYPWQVDTYNLIDKDGFGFSNNSAITGDCDPLPQNGTTAYDYQMLVMPEQATNVSTYSLWYPSDHPAIQNDSVIVLRLRFVIAVVAEDSNLLGFYDYPVAIDISSIFVDFLSDVNGLLGEPRDASENLILWALNMNPQVAMDSSSEDACDQTVVAGFTGGHFMTQYNYDDAIPSTWGATERLIYARNSTPWDNVSAEVTYLTSTTRTLDLLSKINQSIKFDLVTGEQYCVYPQQYDFSQLGSGLEVDQDDPIISGWKCSSGSGSLTISRNVQTRAKVVDLEGHTPDGVTMRLDAGSANNTGTMTFSLYLPSANDGCEIRFGNSSALDTFALVVEKEAYGNKMWVQYRTPEDTLEKICEVWPDEWFSFELWFDNGSNSFLTPNCSTWDVFMSGAMEYAAIGLPSWHPCWNSIRYVDFQVFTSDTVGFDGFGFYAGQFGADEKYSCTSPGTVLFGDGRARSSFYTVSDVYNGTFVYGDPQLEGDEVTLWTTYYSSLQHLMERATVDVWPMDIQFRRVNDSLFDGFEMDQVLNLSFACSSEIAAAELPENPGAIYEWCGDDVPVASIFQHLLVNEWVTEDVEGVPATICFYTGDEVRWEFDWRVGEVDPWAEYCSRHCESWEAIMRNKKLFEALLPFENAKKVAEEYIAKYKDGAYGDFYYEDLIPIWAERRADYPYLEIHGLEGDEDPIINFIRDPVSRQDTIDNYEAYIAGWERILTLIGISGNEYDTVPRVIRRVFARDDPNANIRLSDEFIASLTTDEKALKALGFEILGPGKCPTANTEHIRGGKVAQNYWKMVYTKVQWGDVLDAFRAFVLAIKSEGWFRVIGTGPAVWNTWVNKEKVGGDSPLLYAIGMPGTPTLVWIDWETLDEIWGDLPPLDDPAWQTTKDGKLYMNYYEFCLNNNWEPTGGKIIPRTGAIIGGQWMDFNLINGFPAMFDIMIDPSISDEILAEHPVTNKDPNGNNAAMAFFNRFQRKAASPGKTTLGGLAFLFKNLEIFENPRTPSTYAEAREVLRRALEDIAGVPIGGSLREIEFFNARKDKPLRDLSATSAPARSYVALLSQAFPHINLASSFALYFENPVVYDMISSLQSVNTLTDMLGERGARYLWNSVYRYHRGISSKEIAAIFKKGYAAIQDFILVLAGLKSLSIHVRNRKILLLFEQIYAKISTQQIVFNNKFRMDWCTSVARLLQLGTVTSFFDLLNRIIVKMGYKVPYQLLIKAERRRHYVVQNPVGEDTAKFEIVETDAVPGAEANSPCLLAMQGLPQANSYGILGYNPLIQVNDFRGVDPSDVSVRLTWELIDKDGKAVKTTDSVKEMMEWEGDVKCITSVYERIRRYTSSYYVFWIYSEAENEEYDEWMQWVALYCPPPGEDERIPPELIAKGCVAGALGFAPYCGRLIGAMTFSLFSNLLCPAALVATGNTITAAASSLGNAIQSVSSNPNGFATLMAVAPAEAEAAAAGGGGGTFSYSNWLQSAYTSAPKAGDVAGAASQVAPGITNVNYDPGAQAIANDVAKQAGASFKGLDDVIHDLEENLDYMADVQAETLAKAMRMLKIAAFLEAVFLFISVIVLVNDVQKGADPVTIGLDIYAVATGIVGLAAVLASWYVTAAGVAATAFAVGTATFLSTVALVSSGIGILLATITTIWWLVEWYYNVQEVELTNVSMSLTAQMGNRNQVRHGGLLVGDDLVCTMTVENTGWFHMHRGSLGTPYINPDSNGAPFWFGSKMTAGEYHAGVYDWSSNSGLEDGSEWIGPWSGTENDINYYPTEPQPPEVPQMDPNRGELLFPRYWYLYGGDEIEWNPLPYTPSTSCTYEMKLPMTQPATQLAYSMAGRLATTYDHDTDGTWRQDHDPETIVETTLFGDDNKDGYIDPLYETPLTVLEANLTGFMSNCTAVDTTVLLDEILQNISQACANYQWLDAANNASVLAALAANATTMLQYNQTVGRLQSLWNTTQTWRDNQTATEWHDLALSEYVSDRYYLLQSDSYSEYLSLLGNQTLLASGWRAARPEYNPRDETIYASNFTVVPDNGFPSEWSKPAGDEWPKIWDGYHALCFKDMGFEDDCSGWKDLGQSLLHGHAVLQLQYGPYGENVGTYVEFGFTTGGTSVAMIGLEDGYLMYNHARIWPYQRQVSYFTTTELVLDFDYSRNVFLVRCGSYEASFSLQYQAMPTQFRVYFPGEFSPTTYFAIGSLVIGHWSEHWEGTNVDAQFGGYNLTSPAGQILIPKAWVDSMNRTLGAQELYATANTTLFPCLTNIHAAPSWAEIPDVIPGEVLSGSLEFTYVGTNNPTVAYTLTPPEGWGISSTGGTGSLLSLTEVPFTLTVPVDAPAGVYYLTFNESLADGSQKAGNTTFACFLPIRIYQNSSYYLDVGEFPTVMKAGSVYDWAHLFNSGTQPQQLVITGDGVPSDWLTADGFAPVMVWDFTAPTSDWGYAGGTSTITGGALALQSSTAERVSANVSLEVELHPGDRIHVIYDNDGAVNPVLGAWDSFALSGNGLQVRTFVIDAFETLDGLLLSANVSASTSFRVTHLSIDRALTRYAPLSQLVFAGVSADVGDWGWNASFGSGESMMWLQAPVLNAAFVNSNSPDTNYNNLGYLRTYYSPNGQPPYDYASYVEVPLIEDVIGPIGYQEFGSASRYLAGWRYASMMGSAEDFVAYVCESFDEATLTWNMRPASYPTPISNMSYRVFDEEWVPDPELAETYAYAWDLSDTNDRYIFVNTSIDGHIVTIYDDESSELGGKERPYVAVGVPKVGIDFDSLVVQSNTAETFEISHDLAEGGLPVSLAAGDEVWVNFASIVSSQVTLTLTNANPAEDDLVFVLGTGNSQTQGFELKNFVIPVAGEFTALKISGPLAPAENFSLYFAGVYKYQPNGVSFAEMGINGFYAETIAPSDFTCDMPSVLSEAAGHRDVLALLDSTPGEFDGEYTFDDDQIGEHPAHFTFNEGVGENYSVMASYTATSGYQGITTHNTVLRLLHTKFLQEGYAQHTFSAPATGNDNTVEFWMCNPGPYSLNNIQGFAFFRNDTDIMAGISLDAGNIQILDRTGYHYATSYAMDSWMHIRFDFDITSGIFEVLVNGVNLGSYSLGFTTEITNVQFWTEQWYNNPVDGGYSIYIDALGYNWSGAYHTGENLNQKGTFSDSASFTFAQSLTTGRLDFCVYAPGTNGSLALNLMATGGSGILLNITNYTLACSNLSQVVSPISIYGGWHLFSIGWNCAQHNYTIWYFNQTMFTANYTSGAGILNFTGSAITGIYLDTTEDQAPFFIDGVYLDSVCHPPTNESLVALNYTGAGIFLTMNPGEEWTLRCAPKAPRNYSDIHLSVYDSGQLVGLLHQNVSVNCPPSVAHWTAYSYVTYVTTNKSINWTIIDSCGICSNATWKVLRNGTQISNGSWSSSPKYVNITTRDQDEGTYIYELWVDDGYSGSLRLDSTTVTVLNQPPGGQSCPNYNYSTYVTYNKYAYWNITLSGKRYTGARWEVRLGTTVVNSGPWTKSGELAYVWTGNQAPGSYIYSCYACHGNDQTFHKVGNNINVTAYNAALPASSHPADCSFWTGRESTTLQWVLNDTGIMPGAGNYEVFRNDTTPFKVLSGAFTYNGQYISYTVEDLPPRAYNFSLYVTDGMSGMIWVDNITVWANNTIPTSNQVSDFEYTTYVDMDKRIEWIISDLGAIHPSKAKIQVWLNGSVISTTNFDVSPQDVVVPTYNQMPDIYNYTLWVDDGFTGYLMLDEVLVTVDNPLPWSDSPADISIYDYESADITWTISDPWGIGIGTWVVLRNETQIASGTWNESGYMVTINISYLVLGMNVLTLKINDCYSALRDVDVVNVNITDDDSTGPAGWLNYYGAGTDADPGSWIIWAGYDPSGIHNYTVYYDGHVVFISGGGSDGWSLNNSLGLHTCTVVIWDNDTDRGVGDRSNTTYYAEKTIVDDDTSGPSPFYLDHYIYYPLLYTYCWCVASDAQSGLDETSGRVWWSTDVWSSLGWDAGNQIWYAMVWGYAVPEGGEFYNNDQDRGSGDREMSTWGTFT